LVQFGVAGDPAVTKQWEENGAIQDDPNILGNEPFERGMISFAGSGPNSRTTQMFISFTDSSYLGHSPWETPFGRVVGDGMQTIDKFYSGYGDLPTFGGKGPNAFDIERKGAAWAAQNFPALDFIESCVVTPTVVTVGRDKNSLARQFTVSVLGFGVFVITLGLVCLFLRGRKKSRRR